MSRFIQLHLLTSYPPSNLNRDDLGRPKTAVVGGANRLRLSSQSLKRAWRTSELFVEALSDHIGKRTKRIGYDACRAFEKVDVSHKESVEWGKRIAQAFAETEGKKTDDPYKETILKQPVHLSLEEFEKVTNLVELIKQRKRAPEDEELDFLRKRHHSVDVALFGRMLAVKGKLNYGMEAAAQVAHAITVHAAKVDDDYFTAVDDLNTHDEDAGAAHIGETGFSAGVFYLYICINRDLLLENLQGDNALVNTTLAALLEAVAKVSPTGKQNSFASRAYASYILAERGAQQPRSLAAAFLKPVQGQDQVSDAIKALESQRDHFDQVYGSCSEKSNSLNVVTGDGSLEEMIRFIAE